MFIDLSQGKALFLVLPVLLASPVGGDHIVGVVRDGALSPNATEAPIPAVWIYCSPGERGAEVTALTDAKGAFDCTSIIPGSASVRFGKVGYFPEEGTEQVTVEGEAQVSLELYKLEPEDATNYWAQLAQRAEERAGRREATSFLAEIARLRALGLPEPGLQETSQYLAARLEDDEASILAHRLASLDVHLPGFDEFPLEIGGGASLAGMVTDSTGAAAPGVFVTVFLPESGVNRTAITDAAGLYKVDRLPPGQYQVTAQWEGFLSTDYTVTVGDGASEKLMLTLGGSEVSPEIQFE